MDSEVKNIHQSLLEAGFSEEEIERELNKKAKNYGGFMSEKAILFLIAKENGLNISSPDIDGEIYNEIEEGIDYDEFAVAISEVVDSMSNIVILGRIGKSFGTKDFLRKDGTPGVVGSFLVYDDLGVIKTVLWGIQTEIMKSEYFNANELIRIIGGYSKAGFKDKLEVHLGKKGKVILAPADVDPKRAPAVRGVQPLETQAAVNLKIDDLYDMKEGFIPCIEGVVNSIEEFKEFDSHNGDKSFFLKYILCDDTSSINAVAWGMNAVECLKIINEGDRIRLYNVLLKHNKYTNFNEIYFTKKSRLVKI